MSNIVMFSYEQIFSDTGLTSGPSTRVWKLAKALKKKGNKITILEEVHAKDYSKQGIKIKGINYKTLNQINKYDIAFIPNSNFAKNFFRYAKDLPIVVDLTTPISIEALLDFVIDKNKNNQAEFFFEDGFIPTTISLLNGDYFICSTESQKFFFLGMLNLIGRTTKDNLENIIDLIPTLIPLEKPKKLKKSIIRGKIISKNKKIILWSSSLFSWFDYNLVLKAVNNISKKRDDFALVFVGALNPHVPKLTSTNVEQAKKMCKNFGLLNKYVYFLDWQPYEYRANIYSECDFTVVTYFDNFETQLSYRTRIADCLWGRIPVICTRGDTLSDEIQKHSMGITINPGNLHELENAISELLDNSALVRKMSENIDKFIEQDFNIEKHISKLDKFCKNPKKDLSKNKFNVFKFIEAKEGQNREFKDRLNAKSHTINHLGKTNEKLNEEVYRLTNELNFKKSELLGVQNNLKMKNHTIQDQEKKIDEIKIILHKQKMFIDKYRHSVSYPIYRLTSGLGKTTIGRIIEKLLK